MNRFAKAATVAALTLAVSASAAVAQKKYGPGASDTEIKIGQTAPYSGPASSGATIARAQAAYIKMINEQGGVNGRKITLIQYDDAYSPPKTVEQVRRLVESDEVLAIWFQVGTPTASAVQKYLNSKKVPQLFVGSGAERFNDPVNYPWSIGFSPSYYTEGKTYGQHIIANHPNAKIAVLYQFDDLGRDILSGLKAGLGDKGKTMIVAETSYETSVPTIDSQIMKLKDSGANVFVDIATPKFAAQAIKKLAETDWKPVHFLMAGSGSVAETLKPAGLENAKGIMSIAFAKDMNDPQWKDDPGMNRFWAFMAKYLPEGDKLSSYNGSGYLTAQLLVEVLRRCGDDLTRENLMKVATSLNDIQLDLTLPEITLSTSPTDYHLQKRVRMVKFDGEHWNLFGPVLDASKGEGN
jgi:branched-chain amino acid transport system substrate-binding protein